jgi:hypothetical protein
MESLIRLPDRRVAGWTSGPPEDVEAHISFMKHVSELLKENGEYVDVHALTPARTWVCYGGPDVAPVTTDGPPPETSEHPRSSFAWSGGVSQAPPRT